jgi:hypothetical protein
VSSFREFVAAVRPGRLWETAAIGVLGVCSWIQFAVTGDIWGLTGGVAFTAGAVFLFLEARRKG